MDRTTRMVALINAAHFIDHYFLLIFPTAVLGMGVSFGLSYGELLTLATGSFIAFGAGSLPAGWLGDRWSRRNMMVLFLVGIGGAAILTGFSATPLMLAASLTVLGVFSSIYHPIAGAMLAVNAGDRLGRRMGLNGVFGNLGVAGAALITGALTQWLGWRWAFFVPGLLAIAMGCLFWFQVPDGAGVGPKKAGAARTIPRELVIRVFAVLVLVIMTGGVVFQASTVSLPKLFAERVANLADSAAAVGALVAAIFTVGAMAQLVVGQVVDRFGLKAAFVGVSAFSAPALLGAAFASSWLMLLCAGGIMVAIFGQVTINDTMLARYTTDEWRARVFAVRYFLGFAAAGGAVPLVSYLHDHAGGFTTVFVLLSALGSLVFVGALLFPSDRPTPAARLAAAE
ncbi:MAG: MFS transporter [Alphaproteobacteria bacterium]|nr:MFS transporter [Alphaproteobacteria bacterium]